MMKMIIYYPRTKIISCEKTMPKTITNRPEKDIIQEKLKIK